MVFPFEKHLTDNLKTCRTYLLINIQPLIYLITYYLNTTKTFYFIDSKNLPGEFYATTGPGF